MLNAAQPLMPSFYGMGDPVAVLQLRVTNDATPKGTQRRHISRKQRFAVAWNDAGDVIRVRLPRLFKGHRP
jgi:hypothetical protein